MHIVANDTIYPNSAVTAHVICRHKYGSDVVTAQTKWTSYTYTRLEHNRDSSCRLHVVTVPGLQALSVEILDGILASTKLTDQRSTREAEKVA